MKKLFNKFLAGAITLALVGTLALGISFAQDAKAADPAPVEYSKWTFSQGGQYNAGEPGNEGYIGSVNMADGTSITGWLTGSGSQNQEQTATNATDGWTLSINNTGWDRMWKAVTGYATNRINPWAIKTSVDSHMDSEHQYQVTFKAKASKKKYCYVAFGRDGTTDTPYEAAGLEEGTNVITLGTSETTYTYKFTNWASGSILTTTFMLGCFGSDDDGNCYDYAGDLIPGMTNEQQWSGSVTVSDFSIVDLTPEKPTDPTTAPKPTQKPTVEPTTVTPQPTQAPTVKPSPSPTPVKKLAKVTKVKVKSVKKKTIKVSWKKVANAKKYEIKVGNKTYKATKTSKKIKNKKFKKGKKFKVKVRATATGYTTGAWSKTVKKKLTK